MSKKEDESYGAFCLAGGRLLVVEAPHREWLEWALNALEAQAKRDHALQGMTPERQRAELLRTLDS